MRIKAFIPILIVLNSMLPAAYGKDYSYVAGDTVIGSVKSYTAKEDESLIEIARKFDIGYNEIVDANPDIDPLLPGADVSLKIPTSYILPDVPLYQGVVINLSEMRLYYFHNSKGLNLVSTFPVGIGSEGRDTPEGIFRVIEKMERPSWHVPESIKTERPYLPDIVPPGPDNPLGSHALRLSLSSYLIHGTNRPWAIGRRATHGCIRLYPEDISRLFILVPDDVWVTIVKQPVKVGSTWDKVYIEVHRDDSIAEMDYLDESVRLLAKKTLLNRVNAEKLYKVVREKTGIPTDISDRN